MKLSLFDQIILKSIKDLFQIKSTKFQTIWMVGWVAGYKTHISLSLEINSVLVQECQLKCYFLSIIHKNMKKEGIGIKKGRKQ